MAKLAHMFIFAILVGAVILPSDADPFLLKKLLKLPFLAKAKLPLLALGAKKLLPKALLLKKPLLLAVPKLLAKGKLLAKAKLIKVPKLLLAPKLLAAPALVGGVALAAPHFVHAAPAPIAFHQSVAPLMPAPVSFLPPLAPPQQIQTSFETKGGFKQ